MMGDTVYFQRLADALQLAGRHRPTLVLDLDRLDGNLEIIRAGVAPGVALRVVDKSLPSIPLLAHVMERLGTRRIMSFDVMVACAVLKAFPDVDILFGKPMPTAALEALFSGMRPEAIADFAARTVLLADGAARVEQLAALAKSRGIRLRIALEVDVGMHRGGVETPSLVLEATAAALGSGMLTLEGIMGYEAHIPAIPGFAGGAEGEAKAVRARLAAFAEALPPDCRKIINSGGSKTVLTYADPGAATELSVGSAVVKPTDFDTGTLASLQPAIFIATPALKVVDAMLPGPAWMTSAFRALGLFRARGCFLYGGHWMARPIYPPGMRESKLWGHSSNQQFMSLPNTCELRDDDLVFFRPTQSEAVLSQFGEIQLFSQGRIVGGWPPIAIP
ncbi:D-serine deaminase-like pyridoxal phosphate-dependent protein [Rhizobium aquaticum]|uniref:D-serine deaminase-like pyridoxal phosphate-dependent protein n=1 Tax=Rhizobium aquaticum TaxID=1549636 RepID=A0ABV2J276_9HYPH